MPQIIFYMFLKNEYGSRVNSTWLGLLFAGKEGIEIPCSSAWVAQRNALAVDICRSESCDKVECQQRFYRRFWRCMLSRTATNLSPLVIVGYANNHLRDVIIGSNQIQCPSGSTWRCQTESAFLAVTWQNATLVSKLDLWDYVRQNGAFEIWSWSRIMVTFE